MLISKNIYNALNLLDLNISFNEANFFFLKDSYNAIEKLNSYISDLFKKFVSKSTYKNFLLVDGLDVKRIKFPLIFYFFNQYNLFESLFLNLYSTNLIFLFFKINNNVFKLTHNCYPLFFNSSSLFKSLYLISSYSLKVMIFRLFVKI